MFVLYCLSALPIFANEPLLKYTMRSNCQSEIAFTPPPFFPSPLYVHNDWSLIPDLYFAIARVAPRRTRL